MLNIMCEMKMVKLERLSVAGGGQLVLCTMFMPDYIWLSDKHFFQAFSIHMLGNIKIV